MGKKFGRKWLLNLVWSWCVHAQGTVAASFFVASAKSEGTKKIQRMARPCPAEAKARGQGCAKKCINILVKKEFIVLNNHRKRQYRRFLNVARSYIRYTALMLISSLSENPIKSIFLILIYYVYYHTRSK